MVIPGVFAPLKRNNKILIDGALYNFYQSVFYVNRGINLFLVFTIIYNPI